MLGHGGISNKTVVFSLLGTHESNLLKLLPCNVRCNKMGALQPIECGCNMAARARYLHGVCVVKILRTGLLRLYRHSRDPPGAGRIQKGSSHARNIPPRKSCRAGGIAARSALFASRQRPHGTEAQRLQLFHFHSCSWPGAPERDSCIRHTC